VKAGRIARELDDQVEQVDAGVAAHYPSRGQRAFARLVVEHKQLWVAGELGISQTAVSQLCTGERRPTIEQLIAILERFDVPAILWKLDGPGRALTSTERSRRKRAADRMQRPAIVSRSTADAAKCTTEGGE
jgi:plasmid maintenance system antidote protein VapI